MRLLVGVGGREEVGLTEGLADELQSDGQTTLGKTMGVLAVALAAVNVFGGFMVTRRMLEMFRKKDKPAKAAAGDKA